MVVKMKLEINMQRKIERFLRPVLIAMYRKDSLIILGRVVLSTPAVSVSFQYFWLA
jgi:hypothetical protein